MINTRDEIVNLLSTNSIGCELGVFEGDFANTLINSNKFQSLYLVDIFEGQASNFGKVYKNSSILEKYLHDKFNNDNRIKIFKKDSISFLKSIPENFFDFIYIDTVHSYDQTKLELLESYRTIKNNGYICGHDYCNQFNGVIKAVDEFCDINFYSKIITHEKDFPSFIIKIIK